MGKPIYRSGFEHQVAADLKERGIPFEYETRKYQFKSRVRKGVCGQCQCKEVYQQREYTPDFYLAQSGIDVEAKGMLDGPTRSKMRAVLKDNPDADIRFLFQGKAHWKQGKVMVAWCEKFGFAYAFGYEIPEEWT